MSLVHDHDERLEFEKRSHRIAFSIHAFISCVATDFIDPFVGALNQYSRKHGLPDAINGPLERLNKMTGTFHDAAHGHDHSHDHAHDHDHGHDHCDGHGEHAAVLMQQMNTWEQLKYFARESHLNHWLGAEAVGDVGGAATFIALSEYAPKFMDSVVHAIDKVKPLDDFTTRLACKTTDAWAKEEHIDKNSDAYREELAKWKEFQNQNLAFSSLISVFGTAENLLAHKFIFHNPAPIQELAFGKMLGVAATNTLLMGSRIFAPNHVRWYEDKVSDKIIEPLLEKIDGYVPDKKEEKKVAKPEPVAPETQAQPVIPPSPMPSVAIDKVHSGQTQQALVT